VTTPARRSLREVGRALAAASIAAAIVIAPSPALAHHVGVYTARDNDVSANFKQIKFAIQARKFAVAKKLFDDGVLRKAMQARRDTLPAGLEASAREALGAGDTNGAETALAVFFAALARELAVEADGKLADVRTPRDARIVSGQKFLEAIARYWNLVDFVVSERDPKSAVAIRLAFDEAEDLTRDKRAPAVSSPSPGPRPPVTRAAAAPDPARLRVPIARIAQKLGGVIETLSTTRAPSGVRN
jgi:hypothetical protein